MALITKRNVMGIDVKNAYAHVTSISWDKRKPSLMSVNLAFFASAVIRQTTGETMKQERHNVALPVGSTMVEIYTALKALPVFADATDA